jgi:hypothetical protein
MPVKWGIMSTARINRLLLAGVRDSAEVKVVAVASRTGDSAERFAGEHGIERALASYEALLADSDVEVVYIPLPNSMHSGCALLRLEFGDGKPRMNGRQVVNRAEADFRPEMIACVKAFEARATSSASPEAVWALLADASAWSRWGSWSRVEVEGGAEHGPGAVRVLVRRPFRVRERVTDWVPGERMGYELLDGMRVQGYRSEVGLERAGDDGTVVHWRSTYDRAGPLTALVLRLAVRDACKRVAKAASGQQR